MSEEIIRQTIERAVEQAYQEWAREHPSLSQVIDRLTLTQRTVESLRESEAYQQALTAYHRSLSESGLFAQLLDTVKPLLTTLLTG